MRAMKRGSIFFLRAVIVLVGIAVLAGLLWEPWVEGVNRNADLAGVYFDDPFLAYVYVGSLPFFYGLYQGFKLLGYMGHGDAFSPGAETAVRRIKYCALAVIAFIVGAEAYIIFGVESDDRAGGVAMGLMIALASSAVAIAAARLERRMATAAAA